MHMNWAFAKETRQSCSNIPSGPPFQIYLCFKVFALNHSSYRTYAYAVTQAPQCQFIVCGCIPTGGGTQFSGSIVLAMRLYFRTGSGSIPLRENLFRVKLNFVGAQTQFY